MTVATEGNHDGYQQFMESAEMYKLNVEVSRLMLLSILE